MPSTAMCKPARLTRHVSASRVLPVMALALRHLALTPWRFCSLSSGPAAFSRNPLRVFDCLCVSNLLSALDQPAIFYDSPVSNTKETITYGDLLDRVQRCAGMLAERGVEKGTRVIIYMPMIPEAVVTMLACARLGAIHSVVFGGFAPRELAIRIDDAQPEVVVTASCGIEATRPVHYKPLLDDALSLATHQPSAVVLKQREHAPVELDGRYENWDVANNSAKPFKSCVSIDAMDPLYILYTSGTTGVPKGVVRPAGGHAVVLPYTLETLYDIGPDDVFWTASDVGWVVGHSYIVYAPLLLGCTSVMYEGKPVGTPDAGAFFRVLSEYRVKALFTAPTVFRAIRREDPTGSLIHRTSQGVPNDLSNLTTLFLAGERSDTATLEWATKHLNVPVLDHYWQTETGSPICCNAAGCGIGPIVNGTVGPAVPGWDLHILDEAGHPADEGELGELVAKLPLPPGCMSTLWRNETRFVNAYMNHFPGFYQTMDAGKMTLESEHERYVSVMARTDDIINVAGHRLSTGSLEDALSAHPQASCKHALVCACNPHVFAVWLIRNGSMLLCVSSLGAGVRHNQSTQ
eukprot:m.141036 g.141036  ORF g.141036 m.141036 type:complete len:576 (-) comp17103_c0_seq3:415-2142(-)